MSPVLTAVIMTLLMVSAATAAPPSFCNGLDCPIWIESKNCTSPTGSFEIRRYPAYRWVTAAVRQKLWDNATETAFPYLLEYLQQTGVKPATPILTAIRKSTVVPGDYLFDVSIFLPYANQANPPPSPVPGVFIGEYPEVVVAVRSFPGFVKTWTDLAPQLLALETQTKSVGITTVPEVGSVSQYDPLAVPAPQRYNEFSLVITGGIPASCAF